MLFCYRCTDYPTTWWCLHRKLHAPLHFFHYFQKGPNWGSGDMQTELKFNRLSHLLRGRLWNPTERSSNWLIALCICLSITLWNQALSKKPGTQPRCLPTCVFCKSDTFSGGSSPRWPGGLHRGRSGYVKSGGSGWAPVVSWGRSQSLPASSCLTSD